MKVKNFLHIAVLASAALTASVQASSYTFSFPTSAASVVSAGGTFPAGEIGYFWSLDRGDKVAQSYGNSGVWDASHLELDLSVTRNVLGSSNVIQWDVLVNGQDVGDWNWAASDGVGISHLSLSFAPIVGEFTSLALVVKQNIPSGGGSIVLGLNTLGTVSAVPEPATYGMLLGGLAALGFLKRRKRP